MKGPQEKDVWVPSGLVAPTGLMEGFWMDTGLFITLCFSYSTH